jgi:hypothetical protein
MRRKNEVTEAAGLGDELPETAGGTNGRRTVVGMSRSQAVRMIKTAANPLKTLERAKGIEPSSSGFLHLSYTPAAPTF